jgi:hypothetical protein
VDRQDASRRTRAQLSATRGSLATAQAQAQNPMQLAQVKVQAQYTGKLTQVNAEQRQLTSEEKTVKTEVGQLDATAISLSGKQSDFRESLIRACGHGLVTWSKVPGRVR